MTFLKSCLAALAALYERIVLGRPGATLAAVVLVTLGVGWFAQDFTLDATAESLTLEHDEALNYYRAVRARYGSDDYLVVAWVPNAQLFSDEALTTLERLHDDLEAVEGVASVTSILNVPLVQSPAVDLQRLEAGIRYLGEPGTDRALAKQELLDSPLYTNLLVSRDGETTALRVDLERDREYLEVRRARDALRERQLERALSPSEKEELGALNERFEALSRLHAKEQRADIARIRSVVRQYDDSGTLYLGGVPMIVADSISFIQRDLVVFGSAVLLFLVVILAVVFKKRRWVILPLSTCFATCVFMVGMLGLLEWPVTVVSSNFLALLLILCLALTLHIIVRYREIHEKHPDAPQRELVRMAISRIVVPCAYTAMTTMVAFGSLIVSDIQPVIDFGWMMAIGIVVAFCLSFTLFPAALMLMPPGQAPSRNDRTNAVAGFLASLIERRTGATLAVFGLVIAAGLYGTTRLTVENRFIDYYKQSTEIYQGMVVIDRELGGTTPLDVIIDAPAAVRDGGGNDASAAAGGEGEAGSDAAAGEFVDIYADDTAGAGFTAESYWYNGTQLDRVIRMHDYIDGLPESGKVISLATFARVLADLEPGVLDDNLMLSIIYNRLPSNVADTLIRPYLSEDGDQLRFSVRAFESDPSLHRDEFIGAIRTGLVERFSLAPGQVHLSGMLVLYNNMLHSLFSSQVQSLGAVFVAIMLMFAVLFRSFKISAIAIVPNLVAASIVLGIMGWTNIPLDLMTITIAAITIGIGVDDTIHYVHRFRHEFAEDRNYWAAVGRCHRSIGRAIYYTSVTIMLGFSVLVLSQFVPTIYFGLLTALAMLVALLANMTLLPVLLVKLRAVD